MNRCRWPGAWPARRASSAASRPVQRGPARSARQGATRTERPSSPSSATRGSAISRGALRPPETRRDPGARFNPMDPTTRSSWTSTRVDGRSSTECSITFSRSDARHERAMVRFPARPHRDQVAERAGRAVIRRIEQEMAACGFTTRSASTPCGNILGRIRGRTAVVALDATDTVDVGNPAKTATVGPFEGDDATASSTAEAPAT